MKGFTKVIAREISKETRVYAIENLLVLIMIGSAIALQIRRQRYAKGKGPLLLRLMDELPEGMMPWPVEALGSLFSRE